MTGTDDLTPAERAARRRRLAAVFGDSLPEQTRDDADTHDDPATRPGAADSTAAADARLRREVPPHHGTP